MLSRSTARVGQPAAPSAATAVPVVPAPTSSLDDHDWITCNVGRCRALLVFGEHIEPPTHCPSCGQPTGLPVPIGEPPPKG